MNPDFAVETDTCRVIEGERGGAKAQQRTISKASMALGLGRQFFQASAKALELASHYQPQTYGLRSGGFVP